MPAPVTPTGTVSSARQGGDIEQSTLHLPRIICLHGGGTNARIFRAQCRVLRVRLAPHFRLVFPDAPWPAGPGPDVESVYGTMGPFRSWIRLPPGPKNLWERGVLVPEAIDKAVAEAMRRDDATGATGAWEGVLGFSQGAKMAASLLLRQQRLNDSLGYWPIGLDYDDDNWIWQQERVDYRFGVLLAGRGPLVAPGWPSADEEYLLGLPTLHVHGKLDPGLPYHEDLLYRWCEKESTRLVRWHGNHRVPIKTGDVEAVVTGILDMARGAGAILGE